MVFSLFNSLELGALSAKLVSIYTENTQGSMMLTLIHISIRGNYIFEKNSIFLTLQISCDQDYHLSQVSSFFHPDLFHEIQVFCACLPCHDSDLGNEIEIWTGIWNDVSSLIQASESYVHISPNFSTKFHTHKILVIMSKIFVVV